MRGRRAHATDAQRTRRADQAMNQEEIARLRDELARAHRDRDRWKRRSERLKHQLDAARRAGFRQAAPFAKDRPQGHGGRPGRRAGPTYGRRGRRPIPARVDENLSPRRASRGVAARAVEGGDSGPLASRTGASTQDGPSRSSSPSCDRGSTSRSGAVSPAGTACRVGATRCKPPTPWARPACNSTPGAD